VAKRRSVPRGNRLRPLLPGGWRQADERGFSGARRRQVFTLYKFDLNLRSIGESRYSVFGKMRIQNSTVLEANGLEHGAADGLHDPRLRCFYQ